MILNKWTSPFTAFSAGKMDWEMDHISMKNIHLEMDGNSEMSAMIHSNYLGNYVLENMYIYI